eukprot:Lankesteria_metandrocarpae@DN7062_c1_g1_i2.p2
MFYQKFHGLVCDVCTSAIPRSGPLSASADADVQTPTQQIQMLSLASVVLCACCRVKYIQWDLVCEAVVDMRRNWPVLERMGTVNNKRVFSVPRCHGGLTVSVVEWTDLIQKYHCARAATLVQLRTSLAQGILEDLGYPFCREVLPSVYPPTDDKLRNLPRYKALARSTVYCLQGEFHVWDTSDDPQTVEASGERIYEFLKDYYLVLIHPECSKASLVVAEFLFTRKTQRNRILGDYVLLMRRLLYPGGLAQGFTGCYSDRKRVESIFSCYTYGHNQKDIWYKRTSLQGSLGSPPTAKIKRKRTVPPSVTYRDDSTLPPRGLTSGTGGTGG